MKRIVWIACFSILPLSLRVSAAEGELVVKLRPRALAHPEVVLSSSAFNADSARPIIHYRAFDIDVILPHTQWVFDARQPVQRAQLAGQAVEARLDGSAFSVTIAGRPQPLQERGLGFAPLALGGAGATLAMPRAFAVAGEGRVFHRSGNVLTGSVDGIAIRLFDEDLDGRYAAGTDGVSVADEGERAIFAPLGRILPGSVRAWQVVSLSGDGSSLALRPYTGPAGVLHMRAMEKVECRLALASRDGACSFGLLAGSALTVPAGSYRIAYGYLYRPSDKRVVGLVLPDDAVEIEVAAGATAAVATGDLAGLELPWGEGVATLTAKRLLMMDTQPIQEAFAAADFAKAQTLLKELLAVVGGGANYRATQARLEALRQDLDLETSPSGAALRAAGEDLLAGRRGGDAAAVTASVGRYRAALDAVPREMRDSWAFLCHQARLEGLSSARTRPGVVLHLRQAREPARREIVETIDWQDPKGQYGLNRSYEGLLIAPLAGDYEIAVESLGTMSLTLDGRRLIERERHMPSERGVTVKLTAGAHPFRLDAKPYVYGYSHSHGPHMLRLRWTPPGRSQAVVPSWALWHEPRPSKVSDKD